MQSRASAGNFTVPRYEVDAIAVAADRHSPSSVLGSAETGPLSISAEYAGHLGHRSLACVPAAHRTLPAHSCSIQPDPVQTCAGGDIESLCVFIPPGNIGDFFANFDRSQMLAFGRNNPHAAGP